MVYCIIDIFIIFLYLGTCASKRYDGYKLLRGVPNDNEHLNFFETLAKKYDVNMWQPPFAIKKPVDFIVNPDHVSIVQGEAEKLNISLRTLHSDIQSAFDNQTVNTYTRRNTKSKFNWDSFYRPKDIYDWMKNLSSQYPGEITLIKIGKTIEKRDIIAMNMVWKGSKRRSSVVIEGGIHAREWISPAMVTYIINEMVRARDGLADAELTKIAFYYEWYFIPVLNLDGYEYSHTTDRMWLKNRRGGYGVNLNRNFDAAFGTATVDKINKNSPEYCGPEAFSEPESQNMRNFLKSISKRLPISHYVSFHAYGQYFVIPYSKKYVGNYKEMKQIGDKVAARIKKRYGTKYTVGITNNIMGSLSSGVSACWAKKTHKIPYVAIFELRDKGEEGFALAPSKIQKTCRETMDGLLELFKPRSWNETTLQGELIDKDYYYDYDDYDGESKIVLNRVLLNLVLVLIFSV